MDWKGNQKAGPATMTGRAVWSNEITRVKKGRDGGTNHNGKPSRNVGAKEVRNSKRSYL